MEFNELEQNDPQATEQNDPQATEQNNQQASYDDLLEEYKQSIEQIQKMRELLNKQFSVTNQAPTMESEIDSYLDSENSLTGRLLESYGKDGKK